MKFLVLGAGGQFGFSFLGILKNLENSIKEVQEISGASIGSLIGLFLAAGKSVDEITENFFAYDQSSFTKLNLKNLYKRL
jgi:NTE family protein